jgi:TRAP-type C4-dicarboxylate transport system substrate-binding protein
MSHVSIAFLSALTAMAALADPAAAQATTLRAISAFAEQTNYTRGFLSFIERVNERGKGSLQIRFLGGPKAMPPFEVGSALKTGVVDIAYVTGAYYTNIMPEADAWKLTERPMAELRKSGAIDYVGKLYDQKMNAIFLARHANDSPFHLYLTKAIVQPDLTGLKIRVTPVYRDFFSALGATVVQTSPGEVYTALERGVVDGYGWPIHGIFELGWQEKTKYRVDPGFYNAEVSVLVNKAAWARLNEEQRNVLSEAGQWLETECTDWAKFNAEETARQKAAGIQTITFSAKDADAFRAKAYETGWDGVMRQSPEHGPRLKQFFSKAK